MIFSKKQLPWTILFIIVVLGLGALLGYVFSGEDFRKEGPVYHAVYLTTGDIYFGELGWFPKPHLKNVWYIQRALDENNQEQLGVLPFGQVTWGPENKIYLSPEQIVWTARIRPDSQIVQALSGQAQAAD